MSLAESGGASRQVTPRDRASVTEQGGTEEPEGHSEPGWEMGWNAGSDAL
jgi:hypothetical protein